MAKRCRLCLKEIEKYVVIRDEQAFSEEIIKKLHTCLPELDLNLVRESLMCHGCLNSLNGFYLFKTNCLEAEKLICNYLMQLLDSYIKQTGAGNTPKDANAKKSGEDQEKTAYPNEVFIKQEFITETATENDSSFGTDTTVKIKLEPRSSDEEEEVDVKPITEITLRETNTGDTDAADVQPNSDDAESDAGTKEEKQFECTECGYKCLTNSRLRRHLKTHTGEKPFECRHCDYKCAESFSLRTHLRTHTGEKPFQCAHCSYRASRESVLRMHLRTHTGAKPLECEHCDYKCAQANSLKNHLQKHTGVKKYGCDRCDYTCSMKHLLKRHVAKHTGEKEYKCEYCNYKTTRPCTLKEHLRVHTGAKPFQCSCCDYKASRKSNLRAHVKAHHDKSGETSDANILVVNLPMVVL